MGRVIGIFTCGSKGDPMQSRSEVLAIQGLGLDGDRYLMGTGAYSQSKRVEVREVSAFFLREFLLSNLMVLLRGRRPFRPLETRRNIMLSGINSRKLSVGAKIRIGQAVLEVTGPCEPCDRPNKLAGKKLFDVAFKGRGGRRLRVIEAGVIRKGDPAILL